MAKDFTGEQGVIITAGRTFDFTDEAGAGADDGTPITKEKVMQMMAVFQHLMLDASYTHNGLVENAVSQTTGDTQYYDALVARMVAAINAAADDDATGNKLVMRTVGGCANVASTIASPNTQYAASAVNQEYANQLVTPIGTALPFCSTTLPAGWLECNGAAISRTTYPLLFAAIGTTWGAGDGSTTFTLPDFRHRMLAGAFQGASSGEYFLRPDGNTFSTQVLVGDYTQGSAGLQRYIAGVKFMIRAL